MQVGLSWDADTLALSVRDDGPGIDPALQPRLGREAVSTKREGMGIGLLLAQTTISRLGGSVALGPDDGQGTIARIRIPLARLRADPAAGTGIRASAGGSG